MAAHRYTVILEPEEEGGFHAFVAGILEDLGITADELRDLL